MSLAEQLLISFGREDDGALSPPWLDGPFNAHSWHFRDRGARSISFDQVLPGGSSLIHSQHLRSLNTIRWALLLSRRGAGIEDCERLFTCSTDESLRINAIYLFNTYRYVALHGLSGFSALDQIRVDDIVEKAAWGTHTLLDVQSRLERRIASSDPLPFHSGGRRQRRLDATTLAAELGISRVLLFTDSICTQLLYDASRSQGLYVPPKTHARKREKKVGPLTQDAIAHYIRAIRATHTLQSFGLNSSLDEIDLLGFYPWPGERSMVLAKAQRKRALAQLSQDEKKRDQAQSRTPTLSIQCGLKLVDDAVRFLLYYGDYLLELRDRIYPELYAQALTGRSGSRASHYASKDAIAEINKRFPPQNASDPLCPWPFKSAMLRTRVRLDRRKHEFTRDELEPLVERVAKGELSWREAAEQIGLKHHSTLQSIWRRLADPLGSSNLAERPPLHFALNFLLPASLYIVLATFSFRREIELLDLRDNCLPDSGEGAYIEIYSAKYLRELDLFPCVPVMRYAVKALREWSAPARKLSGDSRLFQVYRNLQGKLSFGPFTTTGPLRYFAAYTGNTLRSVKGEAVELNDHQFRRLSCNVFLHRFNANVGGKFEALSHQLRHRDPAVTERYVREAITGEVYDEGQLQLSADSLTDVMLGRTGAIGPLATHIKRVGDRIRTFFLARIELVTPERAEKAYESWLGEQIKNRVTKIQMAVSPQVFGHCYGRALPLRRHSLCNTLSERKALTEPNFAKASYDLCRNCPNFMALDEHLPCIQSYGDLANGTALAHGQAEPLKATCNRIAGIATDVLRESDDKALPRSSPGI